MAASGMESSPARSYAAESGAMSLATGARAIASAARVRTPTSG